MSTTDTTLHVILQAVIIDGFQRMRPESDIQANAESAARAFRAGLDAFTAPVEQRVGGNTNASLDVTRHYGGVNGGVSGQVGTAEFALADPLAAIQANLIDAASISASAAKALEAFAALQRLADAAGSVPLSSKGAS